MPKPPLPQQLNKNPTKVSRLIEKALWESEGISIEKLKDMLNRAIRFTHPEGNRRYYDYLFYVEGNILYSVKKLRMVADEIITLEKPERSMVEVKAGDTAATVRAPINVAELRPKRAPVSAILKTKKPAPEVPGMMPCEHCAGSGKLPVLDECLQCHGKGCDSCDEGLVPSNAPCPRCQGTKLVKLKY